MFLFISLRAILEFIDYDASNRFPSSEFIFKNLQNSKTKKICIYSFIKLTVTEPNSLISLVTQLSDKFQIRPS